MDFDNFEITATGPLTIKNAHTGEVLWEGEMPVELPEFAPASYAVDEYDALMRRLYLKLHRKLWNWIADETERTHKCVDKLDAFKHFGWDTSIHANCWGCQYMSWRHDYYPFEGNCEDYCLVDWGKKKDTGENMACIYNGPFDNSAFDCWAKYCGYGDWQNAAEAAREIANLPERE